MKHPLPPQYTECQLQIAVAGCGGNGSQVLSGLARLHAALLALGHRGLQVTAFDPDTVTAANVGRQLFSAGDIGQNKARVLINRLNCYYGLNWQASAGTSVSGPCHFLITCVDTVSARQSLSKAAQADYWLDLGNTDQKGQVILGQTIAMRLRTNHYFHPDKYADDDYDDDDDLTPAQRRRLRAAAAAKVAVLQHKDRKNLPTVLDIFPELQKPHFAEDNAPSCSLAEALERQDLFINQTVATFALQLLWQFIRQGGLDIHGYFINLETGKVTPLPIK